MQSLLSLIFLGSVVAIIYSWRKTKSVKNENPDDFESNEDYQKFSSLKKKAIIACVVSFLLGNFFSKSDENLVEEQAKKELGVERQLLKSINKADYDIKYNIDDIKILDD